MRIQFQADADLRGVIITTLLRREPMINFQTAHDAGLAGLHDLKVLEIAARENRLLVSHDHTSMPIHFATFISGNMSSGVVIVPQHLPLNVVVDELMLIWVASDQSEWTNRISYLPL